MRSFFTVIAVLSVTLLSITHAEILLIPDSDNVWICNPNVSTVFPQSAIPLFNTTSCSNFMLAPDGINYQCNQTLHNNTVNWQVTPNTIVNLTATAGTTYNLYPCGLCTDHACAQWDEAYNYTVCSGDLATTNNGSTWTCTESTCETYAQMIINPATGWTFICTSPNCTGTSAYVLESDIWNCDDPNCSGDLDYNSATADFTCDNDNCTAYVDGDMVRTNASGLWTFTCSNTTCPAMTYNNVTGGFTCNAPAPTPTPTPTPSGGSSWFYYIIILAIIGAAVFFGRRHMQKQRLQQELNQHLQKA